MRCQSDPSRVRCRIHDGGITELLNEPAPDDTVDLSSMTQAELLAYAQARGIEGVSSSMLKADIYAAVVAAEEE